MTDVELLQEYAKSGSEAAFAELVTRHASAVYGSALRQVRDPHLAQEVVQAVFILLARKASGFKPGVVLTGWLFRATHFAANDLLKAEYRRHRRETAAYRMNPTDESTPAPATEETLWERVSPVLDHCLAKLGELDRHAILLRFFENKPLAEVGQALGIAEDAARKRVSRALDKLHGLLTQNGASVPAESLSPLLTHRQAGAVPGGLAAATVAAAVSKGVSAKASTTTLAGSVGRQFVVEKLKVWASVGAATALGTAAVSVGVSKFNPPAAKTAAVAKVQTPDNYRPAGFEDAGVVHAFIQDLQARAARGDRAAIARMVRFPLQVNTKESRRVIGTEAELLEAFEATFRPEVVSMILKCPRSGLYCDNRGVMIGSGELWLAPEDRQPRIIALNLP